MFESLGEWSHLPGVISSFSTSPMLWLWVIMGNIVGFVVGVLPGLGPTMGMALCLGVVFKIPIDAGLALLIGITVGSLCSGGITRASPIFQDPRAAATVWTALPSPKRAGRDAVGMHSLASVIGTLLPQWPLFFSSSRSSLP
jgi:putative tricarboxylic transport membrane protein